jgi:hypothetical protein
MPEAVARELISAMRMILTLGGRRKQLLDMRRQKIKDLLRKMDNTKVVGVYNQFAIVHDKTEKRVSFKLPVIEDLEVEGEAEEAHVDIEFHGVREDNARQKAATNGGLKEKASLKDAEDPDIDMEDVTLPTTLQPLAIHNVNPETAPSPSTSPPSPVPPPDTLLSAGIACGKHTNGDCTVVPIQNPEAFPTLNIQEVQAHYYPFARILDMWIHHDEKSKITQVIATVDKGPVDHLIINGARIIAFLGLRHPPFDTICLQHNPRLDETYKIHINPGQSPQNPKAWIFGELASARHGYLYWLDSRQTANPKAPPTVAEAKLLASRIGRRAKHVLKEIEKCWYLEQGSGGRRYRENRMEYLGEDPTYTEDEERRSWRSMWV